MDIKINDFEGPLDLLLHLVSKYQMDIYQVPIVAVIEQYLAYIETLQAMKLEVAGEYMVMASQLMLIKSRRLLPTITEVSSEELDPEEDLLSKIEEYSRFKELSQQLGYQHDQRALLFSKPKQELIFEDAVLNEDKSITDLFLAFSKIMAIKQEEVKNNHTVIERDDFRIEDMMDHLDTVLNAKTEITLLEVFKDCTSINEVITMFLATLELIKIQAVTVFQEGNFSDIILRKESR